MRLETISCADAFPLCGICNDLDGTPLLSYTDQDFDNALKALRARLLPTRDFEGLHQRQRAYVDGSCSYPTSDKLAHAGWAVVFPSSSQEDQRGPLQCPLQTS